MDEAIEQLLLSVARREDVVRHLDDAHGAAPDARGLLARLGTGAVRHLPHLASLAPVELGA
jgi:hypothetical protein